MKQLAIALVSTFLGFVLYRPELFDSVPWLVDVANYTALGGLSLFGLHSVQRVVKMRRTNGKEKEE